MTVSLAQTLARHNILVNGLNLCWIDTGQWDRHHREMGPGVGREEFRGMVEGVIGRFGRPDDVPDMALFLASDLANNISGASIDVSGALSGQITYLPVLMDAMRAQAAR